MSLSYVLEKDEDPLTIKNLTIFTMNFQITLKKNLKNKK